MKSIGLYPRVHIDTAATKIASQAGAVALVETVRAAGLDRGLSQALSRWRKPLARHDPGKIVNRPGFDAASFRAKDADHAQQVPRGAA